MRGLFNSPGVKSGTIFNFTLFFYLVLLQYKTRGKNMITIMFIFIFFLYILPAIMGKLSEIGTNKMFKEMEEKKNKK